MSGETAKHLSEKFGKILQDRQSIAINRNDTSITNSKQLEMAIPPSKISALSSGEFVGMVADDPQEKIELKSFCAAILNDHNSLEKEAAAYKPLPIISSVEIKTVLLDYLKVKKDVSTIVETEIARIMDTPELNSLIVRKQKN